MSLLVFLRENVRFLSAGAVLSFSSSYGQTIFIAIFAAQIMDSYGLSDGQWGALYTLSTSASALVMFWAGSLADMFRVRHLAWVVMPALAVVCLAMAVNTTVLGLVCIVFLLRLLGQGMMTQLAVVAMARWFAARRGLALSISALGLAMGTAAFPVVVASLFEIVSWRTVWVMSGALLMLTIPSFFGFCRRSDHRNPMPRRPIVPGCPDVTGPNPRSCDRGSSGCSCQCFLAHLLGERRCTFNKCMWPR
jgi:MFS family permease